MWVLIWKFVLIFTFVAYTIMFVITAIGGIGDIKHLFNDLKKPNSSE
jgi:amino acid transporter